MSRTPETASHGSSARLNLVESPSRPHVVLAVAVGTQEVILLENANQRNTVRHNAVVAAAIELRTDRQLLELLASVNELAHVALLRENGEVGQQELVAALGASELHDQGRPFQLLNDVGTLTLALRALHGYPFGLALPF